MQQLDLFAPPKPAPIPFAVGDGGGRSKQLRDDWIEERGKIDAARAAHAPEVLTWGKRERTYGGRYLEIALLRDGDRWRVRCDLSMPNMGSGGPFGRAIYESRDSALVATLREQLGRIARHFTAGSCSVFHGSDADWESMARWCIEQGPPALFGGPDLATEFAQLRVTLTERNRLRCEALRAHKGVYVGEDGIERSVYQL